MDFIANCHTPPLGVLYPTKTPDTLTGLSLPPRLTFGKDKLALHPNTRKRERSGIVSGNIVVIGAQGFPAGTLFLIKALVSIANGQNLVEQSR